MTDAKRDVLRRFLCGPAAAPDGGSHQRVAYCLTQPGSLKLATRVCHPAKLES
jgi:hypothetical protein